MTTRPTRAMWWAETALCLAVAAATLAAITALASLAAGGRHVTVDGVPSVLLIALSIGVGIFASGRFRASTGYVFTTRTARPIEPRNLYRSFTHVAKNAELRADGRRCCQLQTSKTPVTINRGSFDWWAQQDSNL
ncbi:hypothetical protein [Streptomyces lydicus]|uniref:hypothetical protein n=1 Tax=Streptomyces lydicus TaxID=47763 RepID=UPI00379EDF29